MSFKKLLLSVNVLILIFIFNGCGQSAYKVFQKDTYTNAFNTVFDSSKVYQDTLQYTKKADLLNNNNEIDAMLHVTYLNPTSKGWDNPTLHSFIIGIFIVNDIDKKYINHEDYQMKINKNSDYLIKELNGSQNILGSIAMENRWAQYYLVQIDSTKIKDNSKDIIVSLQNNKLQRSTKLYFTIHN